MLFRSWELANEGSPKNGKRRKKSAPTLTKNTVSGGAAKKQANKSATGIGVIE